MSYFSKLICRIAMIACVAMGGAVFGQAPAAKPALKALPNMPGRPPVNGDIKIYLKMDGTMAKVTWEQEMVAQNAILGQIEAGQSPYLGSSKYIPGVMEFSWIPAGRFNMGSGPGEAGRMADETRHEVQLTQGFWMGCFEVTQDQWKAVMGKDDKSPLSSAAKLAQTDMVPGKGLPMSCITRAEALEFCHKLTLLVKTKNATSKGFKLPDNWEFTLPTEAQWEYACRAGRVSPYYGGGVLLARDANFNLETRTRRAVEVKNDKQGQNDNGNPENNGEKKEVKYVYEVYTPRVKVVGSGNPNMYGLYDMHGNMWEWCRGDWYEYPTGREVDPAGGTDGNLCVARGGCWYSLARDCRAASRLDVPPSASQTSIGFRVVLIQRK